MASTAESINLTRAGEKEKKSNDREKKCERTREKVCANLLRKIH